MISFPPKLKVKFITLLLLKNTSPTGAELTVSFCMPSHQELLWIIARAFECRSDRFHFYMHLMADQGNMKVVCLQELLPPSFSAKEPSMIWKHAQQEWLLCLGRSTYLTSQQWSHCCKTVGMWCSANIPAGVLDCRSQCVCTTLIVPLSISPSPLDMQQQLTCWEVRSGKSLCPTIPPASDG